MPLLDQQISDRIQAFASEITELARQQALEILSEALVSGSRAVGRRPGRGNGAGARPGPRRSKEESRNRRSPEEIDRASQTLLSEIKANPGLRVEQIGQALGASTKDLTLPLKKLLSQRLVRSEGQRRATRYFPTDRELGKSGKGGRRGKGRGGKKAAAAAPAAE